MSFPLATPLTPVSIDHIRVGVDGGQLAQPNTGIGRYTFELCRVLDSLLPNAEFFVYSKHPVAKPVESSRWKLRSEPVAAARRLHDWLWISFRCSAFCAEDNLNIFCGLRTLTPFLPASIKSVVLVHDLFHLQRQLVSFKRWLLYRFFVDRALKRANVIVTNSDFTSSELKRLRNYKTDAVVRPGVSSEFRVRCKLEIDNCLRHYRLSRPYLLNVSRWDPRKNLSVLLRSFLDLKKDGLLPEFSLALIGGPIGNQRGNRRLLRMVRGGRDAGIRMIGRVPEDHLAALYSGCSAFVFPSSYEGFGIPVLEARACGARVIAADTSALREAGENESVYVAPTVEGVREGILATLRSLAPHSTGRGILTWRESGELFARALLR